MLFKLLRLFRIKRAYPHCKTVYNPRVQKFKCTVKYNYSIFDEIQVTTEHHNLAGSKGIIVGYNPFTFAAPAYEVLINGRVVPISERSMVKV